MPGIVQLPTYTKRIAAFTTTYTFNPCTPWIPAAFALQSLRAVLRSDTEVGQVYVQMAVQTAEVDPTEPSDWATLGAAVSAPSSSVQDLTLATQVASAQWVRFGVAFRASTATGHGQATVSVDLAFTQRGNVVGQRTEHLVSTSTDVKYLPITSWVPTHVLNRVLVSLKSTGSTGSPEWRIAYQLAEDVVGTPANWTATGAYQPLDGVNNSGEVALTLGMWSWIRFGVAYKSAVGTTFAQADTQVVVSTRRA